MLSQGQVAAAVTALYTAGGTTDVLVSSVHLFNTGGTAQNVDLYINGTAGSNQIAQMTIPAGGFAVYDDGRGWTVYTAAGVIISTTSVVPSGLPGGLGTPNSAAQALTASTANVISGTLFQLPTGGLSVGSRFRFQVGLIKTAVGVATWQVAVKWGTAGTNADAAIASWTSGTNTAAIDQATMEIEVAITALGSAGAATAACIAMYVNTLTNATGLGVINFAPTSTAGFDSTAANPFMHVDVTPGASAVMTGVGSAERLV